MRLPSGVTSASHAARRAGDACNLTLGGVLSTDTASSGTTESVDAGEGAPLRHIIRDTMPFVIAMIVALAIITFIPETVLWLPRMMGYKG